jgi:hypothetical protein
MLVVLLKHERKSCHENNTQSKYKIDDGNHLKIFGNLLFSKISCGQKG